MSLDPDLAALDVDGLGADDKVLIRERRLAVLEVERRRDADLVRERVERLVVSMGQI